MTASNKAAKSQNGILRAGKTLRAARAGLSYFFVRVNNSCSALHALHIGEHFYAQIAFQSPHWTVDVRQGHEKLPSRYLQQDGLPRTSSSAAPYAYAGPEEKNSCQSGSINFGSHRLQASFDLQAGKMAMNRLPMKSTSCWVAQQTACWQRTGVKPLCSYLSCFKTMSRWAYRDFHVHRQ